MCARYATSCTATGLAAIVPNTQKCWLHRRDTGCTPCGCEWSQVPSSQRMTHRHSRCVQQDATGLCYADMPAGYHPKWQWPCDTIGASHIAGNAPSMHQSTDAQPYDASDVYAAACVH